MPTDTYKLFYPGAPATVLADPKEQGHLYRRGRFLIALEHLKYHSIGQFVLEHPEEGFLDIQATLRVGRHNGKIISQLISHVAQWINPHPTKVADRENNKPQLWRDFIPALTAEFGSKAEQKSRELQRQIFDVVQSRLDELEGSLEGDMGKDSYLERFRSPI